MIYIGVFLGGGFLHSFVYKSESKWQEVTWAREGGGIRKRPRESNPGRPKRNCATCGFESNRLRHCNLFWYSFVQRVETALKLLTQSAQLLTSSVWHLSKTTCCYKTPEIHAEWWFRPGDVSWWRKAACIITIEHFTCVMLEKGRRARSWKAQLFKNSLNYSSLKNELWKNEGWKDKRRMREILVYFFKGCHMNWFPPQKYNIIVFTDCYHFNALIHPCLLNDNSVLWLAITICSMFIIQYLHLTLFGTHPDSLKGACEF